MGFFDRFRSKDSAAQSVMARSRLNAPIWSKRNYRMFAMKGYVQNVIGYRCVREIAEAASQIPIVACEKSGKEIPDHPFLKLLRRPNPWQGQEDFIDSVIAYWRLAGNAFIEAVDLNGDIEELYSLNPDRMKIILGSRGYPAKYQFGQDGNKVDFDVELAPNSQIPILHLREFNPVDDFYGMSPFEPAMKSVDTHNKSTDFNKSLLDNQGSPSGMFTFANSDETLTDKQYARLKKQIDEDFSGPENAGRPLIGEGGMKWEAMGMKLKDLEFLEGKREVARETAIAMGVPPMLLGIPGDNTYANYAEANRAFYRSMVIPLFKRFLGSMENWIAPTYDITLKPDLENLDALAIEREKQWDRVQNSTWMTTAEKREATNFGPYKPDNDPSSRIMINGGMIPLEDAVDPDPADGQGGPEPEPGEGDEGGEE